MGEILKVESTLMQCTSAVSMGFFTWKEERSTSQGPYLLVWITLELLYLVLHLLLLLYLDLLYTVEYWKEKGNCIILQHIWTIWNPPEDNGNSVKCTNIWQCAYYWQYLTMCIILITNKSGDMVQCILSPTRLDNGDWWSISQTYQPWTTDTKSWVE